MFFLAKVVSGLSTVERQIQESRGSLVKDIQVLSELLAKLGKETPRRVPGWGVGAVVGCISPCPKIQGSHFYHVTYRRLCSYASPV